ncbi:MAG: PPOX class F420-dependent oxidoreductase [Microthrixaceae bacterium]
MTDAAPFDDTRYVALTTFRRSGEAVTTPVWVVPHDGGYACTTGAGSGKLKRLRHTARVELSVCDARGRVAEGTTRYEGTARVVEDPEELGRIRSAVARRYGLQARLLDLWSCLGRLVGRSAAESAVAWTVGPTL